MAILLRQECSTVDGATHIEITSDTNPDKHYQVFLLGHFGMCECPSYKYNGGAECKHIKRARLDHTCGWIEGTNVLQQTPHQERQRVCPQCGNETKLVAVET